MDSVCLHGSYKVSSAELKSSMHLACVWYGVCVYVLSYGHSSAAASVTEPI